MSMSNIGKLGKDSDIFISFVVLGLCQKHDASLQTWHPGSFTSQKDNVVWMPGSWMTGSFSLFKACCNIVCYVHSKLLWRDDSYRCICVFEYMYTNKQIWKSVIGPNLQAGNWDIKDVKSLKF